MATLLALATMATLAFSQSCPSGYAPYQGSNAPNQTVRWVSCPYSDPTNDLYEPTLQCGTIQVPVDYTDRNSKMMTLALVKIPSNSTSSTRKSIVYNPGGPGVGGISSLVGYGPTYVQLAGGQYDIVTFDPRGTGLTNPYACPYPATQPSALGLPLSDPKGLNATYTYNLAQGDICNRTAYRSAGELVGTAFVARDVDAIFQALNEDGKIRYWGFSYGTLLGSTIAAMFPNKIDRMVLDGNINPTDYYHGTNEESVDDVDAAVKYFFQTCATAGSDYCPLAGRGVTGAQLENQFRNYITGLQNGTYTTRVQGETYSYGDVKGYVFSQLKAPRRWATVASNIAAFYQGTTGGRLLMKRQTSASSVPFSVAAAFDDKTSNALEAITCGDWDDINASLQDYSRYLQLYNQRSFYGGDQLISILLACSTWDVNAREQYNGEFTNINTSTPILFVNGPYDPVTPLSSAQNSSSGFKNSALLQTMGAGHCSTAHPSTCIRTKVASYFSTGKLPDVSQVCQPDNAPFSGAITSSGNYTDVPGGTTNKTREVDDFDVTEEFRQAIQDAVTAIEPKVGFQYHSALLDLVKRDEASALQVRALVARQSAASSAAASCTPTTRAQPSGSSSGSGSSSANKNAAGQIAIVGSLTFVGVAAGFILALF